MRSEHPRVTVVNDSPEFLELMQDLLQDATYPATLIDGARDNALELVEASRPDVLIIDLRMGDDELHGLRLLHQARERSTLQRIPTLVCTADRWALETLEPELETMERVAVLAKPFSITELYAAIDSLLEASN
jgi:CheY-like chemotaxis protein